MRWLRGIQGVWLGLVLAGAAGPAARAQTAVRGVVTDAATREPLPFVSVAFDGTSIGTVTDMEGKYLLLCAEDGCTDVRFTSVGYRTVVRRVEPGRENVLNVAFQPDVTELPEAEVRGGKRKRYRNRDNPAVELARAVIAHKDSNRMESHDFIEYEEYEKLQMSLSGLSEKLKGRKLFKQYAFLFENTDTTLLEGRSVLPIYLKETIAEKYWRREPERRRTVVKGTQRVSFEEYLDDQGLVTYLNYLYNDIDIYANSIPVLTNLFLSPIADAAPTFYAFFITDTVDVGGERLVELSFVPRNTSDFLFQGRLYVSLDGRYSVRQVEMGVNKRINLNWVRDLKIDQRFERDATGRFPLVHSRMRADLGISKSGGGIYGERSVSLRDIVTGREHPLAFYSEKTPEDADTLRHDDAYWTTARHQPLTAAESKVYQNIDSLKKMPSFRRAMDIATLVLAGYKGFGPWELGPVNTFYSFNPVEGLRLRVGGRTTTQFSERIYFEGYTAYGFKDERWKYLLGTTYSFTGRSIWRFPVRSLRLSYQHDTKIPGQELQFVQEDFVLLSFKRGVNDKWLYNDIWNLEYWHELESRFSFRLGYRNWTQSAAGGLRFVAGTEPLDPARPPQEEDITLSELSLELRWAPHEQFFQGKNYRIPMANKWPILTLRVGQGFQGLLGGESEQTNLRLSVYKRFHFPQFGFLDMTTEGGYIAGKVPYPLLTIHRANQTYSYQLQSYNLMNFLEFVSDTYASVNLDYSLGGALFNKIPLLKKLKWREVATCKVLYGSLRRENDPAHDPALLPFPTDAVGRTTTFALDDGPYVEGSVGIANIFKLFRVDVVRRFSYLDHPDVSEWGIRARFKLDF